MLRDAPILFDAVDRAAWVDRGKLQNRLLRAAASTSAVLLIGERGAGRTSLLNWLSEQLRTQDKVTVRVNAALADRAANVLDLLIDRLIQRHPSQRDSAPRIGTAPLVEAGETILLQEKARRLRDFPETWILIDDLYDASVSRKLFGGLRDFLWESGHHWVVTARPSDRPAFLAPPADAFFAERIEIPPLNRVELKEFARHASQADPKLLQLLERKPTSPRDAVRLILNTGPAPSVRDAQESLGKAIASVLGDVQSLGRPVGADDSELLAATGLSEVTLRKYLNRLVSSGYLEAETARGGAPGRPRKVYVPLGADLL